MSWSLTPQVGTVVKTAPPIDGLQNEPVPLRNVLGHTKHFIHGYEHLLLGRVVRELLYVRPEARGDIEEGHVAELLRLLYVSGGGRKLAKSYCGLRVRWRLKLHLTGPSVRGPRFPVTAASE